MHNQKYCSPRCRHRASYKRCHPKNFEPKVCKICGKEFYSQNTRTRIVCLDCQSIRDKFIKAQYKIRHKHACPICGKLIDSTASMCHLCYVKTHSGRNSPNFREEPRKTKGGYIFVPIPEHPFCNSGGMVAQHRLVIEKKIGRYLTPDEIVHHLNGIRDDNRPQNLVITKCHSHSSWTYIKALQKRIRDLEVQLAQQKF